MTATTYTLSTSWTASARYTAAADIFILLSNPSTVARLSWTLTTDDTAPAIAPEDANPLWAGNVQPMQLAAGERLWLAGASDARASVEV